MRNMNKITTRALAFFFIAGLPLTHAQLSISPANLGHFTTTIGKASTTQALTINATSPIGAIVVTAPAGFEVSTNLMTGFAPSITLGKQGGVIQSVYRGSFNKATGKIWEAGSGREFPNSSAFAAITANGSVVAWGSNANGGSATRVAGSLSSNVTSIYSNGYAFAALKQDGSVVTWGSPDSGGNSSIAVYRPGNGYAYTSVEGSLGSNVTEIYSNDRAFAALKKDGSVVTWGDAPYGGNSTSVAGSLRSNVTEIYSNDRAFAALKKDGSVVTWGDVSSGGNSTSVAGSLSSNVTAVYSNASAFAAIKKDGSVVTWGDASSGGNSTSVAGSLSSSVKAIFSTRSAFAALKVDGSVVTWGDSNSGGNSSIAMYNHGTGYSYTSVAGSLSSNVAAVFSNRDAFAALKTDGSLVTWGRESSGGDSLSVSESLSSNVTAVFSTSAAFAALKTDGSLVIWGDPNSGGKFSISTYIGGLFAYTYTTVAGSISSNVTSVFSTNRAFSAIEGGAFAAIKKDGSVVTWGGASSGGNSASVAGSLSSNVTAIYSTASAFAAVKTDGSVVTWGDTNSGGASGPANIGASISGLPSQVYVRLASSAQASKPSGELVFSSLATAADDYVTEIERRSLSGTIQSIGDYTGSPNPSEVISSNTAGPAQVQKSKKGGKVKASSAKKARGGSTKLSASKPTGGKKSGGKKKRK